MSDKTIGENFPATWVVGQIGDVAEFVRGVTYQKSEARNQLEDGYIPLLRATNIGNESITYDEFVYVPRNVVKSEQLIQFNDMVVAASSGSISVVGKSAPVLKEFEATFGAFCAVLRPKEGVLPGFFRLYVQSPSVREAWSNLARGTNINNLKREQVLSTSMPIAPLSEQEKIVEILDEHLSRLDAALTSVRAVRDKSARFRRSLLRSALHPNDSTSSGEVKLSPLSDCAELSLGIMLDRAKSSGEYLTPYLGNINVRWGEFNQSELKLMDIRPEQVERSLVRQGDVVVCEGGEPGRTAVWRGDQPVSIQKALHRVRPLEHMDASFIAYCLELEFRGVSEHGLFTGTTIKHLPKEKLKRVMIPVVSLSKQKETVLFLDEQTSRLGVLISIVDVIEQKALLLRRSLLQSAFSGELTRQWREGVNV